MAVGARARYASDAEIQDWDAHVLANPGGGVVWTGAQFLGAKRLNNYLVRHVVVERPDRPNIAVAVAAKKVPLLGEWWSLLGGPAGENLEAVTEAVAAIAELAAGHRAFFLQIEPQLTGDATQGFIDRGYLPSMARLPNVWTVRIELRATEEEIFQSFAKKTRNAINKARREGVYIERVPATAENSAKLFQLLKETADGRFPLRPEKYYRAFWREFSEAGQGQMFLAYREGDDELLAGAYALRFGDTSYYKDGASLRVKKAYGVSHLLQWEVMRWGKESGMVLHDLCGTPPANRADDQTHALHGVGKFKRSFKDEVFDFAGAFELPLRPGAFKVWKVVGDRIARRLSLWFRNDPYY